MNKMLVIGYFRPELSNANADGDWNGGSLVHYGRLCNDLFQFFSYYDSSFEMVEGKMMPNSSPP